MLTMMWAHVACPASPPCCCPHQFLVPYKSAKNILPSLSPQLKALSWWISIWQFFHLRGRGPGEELDVGSWPTLMMVVMGKGLISEMIYIRSTTFPFRSVSLSFLVAKELCLTTCLAKSNRRAPAGWTAFARWTMATKICLPGPTALRDQIIASPNGRQ